jgi:hypothetical protein
VCVSTGRKFVVVVVLFITAGVCSRSRAVFVSLFRVLRGFAPKIRQPRPKKIITFRGTVQNARLKNGCGQKYMDI